MQLRTNLHNPEMLHNDKYMLILENNRALKRKIKELENYIDSKEMEFEKGYQSLNSNTITKDKDLVSQRFGSYKELLDCYNHSLSKINENLHPVCQVRSSFIERLVHSYNTLFDKLKSYHYTEMTKYIVKINLLLKKNKQYEKIFDEIKK